MPQAVRRSNLGGMIPRQQVVDLTLFMPADDGPKGLRQIYVRLDGVELGVDKTWRSSSSLRPVLR